MTAAQLADALDDLIPCDCAVCGPPDADRVAVLTEAATLLRRADAVVEAATRVLHLTSDAEQGNTITEREWNSADDALRTALAAYRTAATDTNRGE